MYKIPLLVISIVSFVSSHSFFVEMMNRRMLKLPNNIKLSKNLQIRYFEQKLDHFNLSDNRTWKQKYFINDELHKTGGPIFLLIGGEAQASDRWMSYGAWYEYASNVGASLLQLEHRYYGDSHPTENLSVDNMKYLSSKQALEDLAMFISSLKENDSIYSSNKWIVFGGSYSASLALWLKDKFPNLIDGVVSSSGPLEAKLDYYEYLEVVDINLANTNPRCQQNVREGMKMAEVFLNNTAEWEQLTQIFNLCEPFDGNSIDYVYNFFGSMMSSFYGASQYDRPESSSSLNSYCNVMLNEYLGTALERIAHLTKMQNTGGCLDMNYEQLVRFLGNETWEDHEKAVGYRQWIYQTCTEFGWYQSSNMPEHPYTNYFPVEASIKLCSDVFGSQITAETIQEAVFSTNKYYGGRNPHVKNTISIHGSVDPWHAMGATTDLDVSSPTILINGTSHCSDMYPSDSKDIPQLTATRKIILDNIKKWIEN